MSPLFLKNVLHNEWQTFVFGTTNALFARCRNFRGFGKKHWSLRPLLIRKTETGGFLPCYRFLKEKKQMMRI